MTSTLQHPRWSDAKFDVYLDDLGGGRRRVRVTPRTPNTFIRRAEMETDYTDDLLQTILEAKGASYLCDEIAREQDPDGLSRHLGKAVTAHVDPADLAGRRVLDFGCGAGASTCILSRLLPGAQIVGVDLLESNLSIARSRVAFHGLPDVTLARSPDGSSLPPEVLEGGFALVVLSAVFEHLLPAERTALMPVLWALLKPGGLLVIDETPWRWSPYESHTVSLPFVNYLPRPLAHRAAWRSSRIPKGMGWPELLRDGMRGATVPEIMRAVGGDDVRAGAAAPGGRGRLGRPVLRRLRLRQRGTRRTEAARQGSHEGDRADGRTQPRLLPDAGAAQADRST